MSPDEQVAVIEVSLGVMESARDRFLDGQLSEDELRVICTVTQQDIDRVRDAHSAR